MKCRVQKKVAAAVVMSILSGCATTGSSPSDSSTNTDATRTKVEGTAVGSAIGAALGAAIGSAVGGKKGALAGAAIGLGVGAIFGYAAGTTVAERKQTYANAEDRLNGEIKQVAKYNSDLIKWNGETTAKIKEMDKAVLSLKSRLREGTVQLCDLWAKRDEIQAKIDNDEKIKTSMTSELVALNEYQNSIGQTQNQTSVAELKQGIQQLQENIAMLDTNNTQMAQLVKTLPARS